MNTRRSTEVEISTLQEPLLDPAVALHMRAFHGALNSRLGKGYVRAFLAWFAADSDGIALIANAWGNVGGYVVGAPLGYQARMNKTLAPIVARSLLVRPSLLLDLRILGALWSRIKAAVRPSGEAPPNGVQTGVVSLVGIAVDPEAQGGGVGGALVSAFEDECRERGARWLRLSVYPENTVARRLYERSGWEICEPVPKSGSMYYMKKL